ncbi:blood vessel epicardial substance-like isoform X2 [Pseudomyrmex gracilis]|uniref:blood vessel epicardial substance-like isoform X2 n=1 Tax=Pseudomyrmex gracilis TaxID=219809 RepID=UPI000994AA13|nr:blood vessel epicardial substance-like isoform X2 [Pseudomyrmex gracilis]
MARVTRLRQKMANATDSSATAASNLLSSSTTTSFTTSTSAATYSTEDYTLNYSSLPGLGGYSLNDFNYTALWLDVWNSTEINNVTEKLNATVLISGGYCVEWEAAQHKLFQAANLFFAAAFLVPRWFKASVLALRTFLTAGFMLAALWAGITICALDAMLWCLALGLLNGIHSLILACRFLPPALSPELAELYLKLFKPYKVSKKHFQELAKEARILKLDSDQTYATEGVTPADKKLSILLRGKLNVTCDGTHLHYIRAYQFVDSPEWEAMHESDADVFQVTIRAEEPSTYICWTRMKLLRVLRHRPLLKVVLHTLIGGSRGVSASTPLTPKPPEGFDRRTGRCRNSTTNSVMTKTPRPDIRISIGHRWWQITSRRPRRLSRAKISATRYCRRVSSSRRRREHPRHGSEAGTPAAITPCYLSHRSSRGSDRKKELER